MKQITDKSGLQKVKISTTLPKEIWQDAYYQRVSWQDALIMGISFYLSEKGIKKYENYKNLDRRYKEMRKIIGELNAKLSEYEKVKKAADSPQEVKSTELV